MESEVPDHILSLIRKKYITGHKNQCPYQLKNMAMLELAEKQVSCELPYSFSLQQINTVSKWSYLSYNNLFKGGHSSRNLGEKIIVVGEAGIGKTTLCTAIAKDWADRKFFQEFLIVLLLPLSQRSVALAKNLLELLKNLYSFDDETCSTIDSYLTSKKRGNILIIADEWDKFCTLKCQKESFLYRLLFTNLFPNKSVTIVVTSRCTTLCLHFFDRFIAVQGFSEETIRSCIQFEFSNDSDKLTYILKQLDNPLIQSLCCVPLNLALICSLCQSESCEIPLPSTMPELYHKLIWNLIQKKINMQGNIVSKYQDLPDKLQKSWLLLCQLAFNNIEKCHAALSQIEASNYLSSDLEVFGLLKCISSGKDKVPFSFVHPIFEYYAAAVHLIGLPQDIQLQSIEKMSHINPIFWRFFFNSNENENSLQAVHILSKFHHSSDMHFCHYLFECKNKCVHQEIIEVLIASGSTIMLHSQNRYDCASVIHVLENIEEQCTVEINFQKCKIKSVEMSKLSNTLGSRSNIQIKGLDLSDNGLNDSIVVDFFKKIVNCLQSLEMLVLNNCGIGEAGLASVFDALTKSSCKGLAQLDLSFNYLSTACLESFKNHIGCFNKLEILTLKGSLAKDVDVSYLKHFIMTLTSNCQYLRRLDLSANNLGDCDDPDLNTIVSQLIGLRNNFDLRLDDKYMSNVDNSFLAVMEESIRNKGTINHTIAHGVIVGPGRSGKNTLMRRLMGEGPPDLATISSSTGVIESVVKVEVKKFCAVATAVSNLKWQRLEYDEEALELIMTTAKHYSHSKAVSNSVVVKYITSQEIPKLSQNTKSLPCDMDRQSLQSTTKAIEQSKSENIQGPSIDEDVQVNKHVVIYSDELAPVDVFKNAVKLRRMDALREHLESSWSLYLTNTGGQVEFQELLPLLLCGPSIFFVTIPLHLPLDKPYDVHYQYSDRSVKKYLSSSTMIQDLLQILATIDTLDDVNVQVGGKAIVVKPKIFFVGTHKDCLPAGSETEKTISQIDATLQRYIRQTSLFRQGSIQFASDSKNGSENRLIFTVNNLSQEEDDFQKIRSAVQQTVLEKCYTEFTVRCPSSWLIFSLVLRAKYMSNRILTLDECYKIGQECGILNHDELSTALSFIHSRLGLLRYFLIEGLDHLVVIDPQVLFDAVTDLIIETLDSRNAEQNEIEEFRERGIISVKVMERISRKSSTDVKLPFEWLTKLLNHLQIVALFKDNYGEKYFFPSMLCRIPEAQVILPPSDSQKPPALIMFETGFCPRGVFGALIVCLMNNGMKSSKNWELLPNRIFRNQVSFSIEAYGDVMLRKFPTHLEIMLDSDTKTAGKKELQATCEEAFAQICKSMKLVTNLHKKCKYLWTFYCTLTECKSEPHPSVVEWRGSHPFRLRCKVYNRRTHLPSGYKIWNIQKKHNPGHPKLNSEVPSHHLNQIASLLKEWEGEIADQLQLQDVDVEDIKTKYPRRLKLQSREALHTWKQRNGSKATYRKLMRIFERAGYRDIADKLAKLAEASDCETDESSSSDEDSQVPQPLAYPSYKPPSFSQLSPAVPKSSGAYYVIVKGNVLKGDANEDYTKELLESHNVMKSFVPKLSSNEFCFKGDTDLGVQHLPKVDASKAEGSSLTLPGDLVTASGAGDADKDHSTEVLESHSMMKSCVPKLSASEFSSEGDTHIGKCHLPKLDASKAEDSSLILLGDLVTADGIGDADENHYKELLESESFVPKLSTSECDSERDINLGEQRLPKLKASSAEDSNLTLPRELVTVDGAVDELEPVLPLKIEKGSSNRGEIGVKVRLNDLHIHVSKDNTTTESDCYTQDSIEIEVKVNDLHLHLSKSNSTIESNICKQEQDSSTTGASATGTQNGPILATVAGESVTSGVASLSEGCNLNHLGIPKTPVQTGSISQATITTASTTPARVIFNMSTASSSANNAAQTIISTSDQQTGLAEPVAIGVAAVGGATTITTVTSGNASVPASVSPSPNQPLYTSILQNNPTVAAVAAESVASGVASLSDDCNLMHLEIPKPQAQTWSMSQATITSASITPACTKSTMSTASNNANEPVQTILSASDRQTGLANPGTFGVTAVGGIATIATVPTTTLLAPNQLHHIVSMPQTSPTLAAVATESIASRVTSLADDYNPIHLETPKPQGRTGNMSQATINTASTTSAHAKSTVSIVSSSANEAAQAIISASNQQTGLTLIDQPHCSPLPSTKRSSSQNQQQIPTQHPQHQAAAANQPIQQQPPPLPPGWECQQDPQRRVYYVDHNTHTATWQKPVTENIRNSQPWQQQETTKLEQKSHQKFLAGAGAQPKDPNDDRLGTLPEGSGVASVSTETFSAGRTTNAKLAACTGYVISETTTEDDKVYKILSRIDNYYSHKYHMRMLRFLAQAVVPNEQLINCKGVPEVYKKMVSSKYLRTSESAVAVTLLRHMLRITGYNSRDNLEQLGHYCSTELDLESLVPSLPFYELLLFVSFKLTKSMKFEQFLSVVDKTKLNLSVTDVSSSPLDVFQSMIYQTTLDPKNHATLIEEVVPLLESCKMTDEAEFIRNRLLHGVGSIPMMIEEVCRETTHDSARNSESVVPETTARARQTNFRCSIL